MNEAVLQAQALVQQVEAARAKIEDFEVELTKAE
jgi:hypothetical protein